MEGNYKAAVGAKYGVHKLYFTISYFMLQVVSDAMRHGTQTQYGQVGRCKSPTGLSSYTDIKPKGPVFVGWAYFTRRTPNVDLSLTKFMGQVSRKHNDGTIACHETQSLYEQLVSFCL